MAVTIKRHLLLACVLCWYVVGGEQASASIIVAERFESRTLARQWAYTVYLPDGYDASSLRYPVLYLLHGHDDTLNDWSVYGRIQSTTDALIAQGEIPPTIIVMPDAGTTWYVDRKERMESAILQDLIPRIETRFRTIAAREGRVIGGLSMGGYGSLRFALNAPERFAAAALLSPAIYDPEPPAHSGARRAGVFGSPEFDAAVWRQLNYPALLAGYLAKKLPVPMYINSGDDDEYMIEAEATKLYSRLRANGQPAELRIVDGSHSWLVWEATVGDAMKYICRYVSRPLVVDSEEAASR